MKTKVLVVDDSAYTRQTIKKIIEADAGLEVAGIASDGIDAMAKTLKLQPDIITLDFEMPEMDGFSFLRWLMKERPTPVIMVSSYTDSKTVFKALDLGAVDFIAKPARRASLELQTIEKDLIEKLRGIKNIRLDILSRNLELLEDEKIVEIPEKRKNSSSAVVAIGSSTGGPAALQIILTRLPADFEAAMVISQHMPRGFTGSLAERLNKISRLRVKEAEDGEYLKKGTVYICPGGFHLSVRQKNHRVAIALKEGLLTDKYTPSIDYMMASVADRYGDSSIGVILTGMGNDGKNGLLAIKTQGGYTIAEAESSAVVFGMPAEAIKNGAAETILPISEIPSAIIRAVNSPHKKGKH
ncbi:MAG: chemotaxis response regulator protein-glutamate methylesterase [Nitrospiraceae bacterium]|nr:MAG: chemotaxis response regulator protein-glutamate methylesterase [Nitrospiraceae bacterium]